MSVFFQIGGIMSPSVKIMIVVFLHLLMLFSVVAIAGLSNIYIYFCKHDPIHV